MTFRAVTQRTSGLTLIEVLVAITLLGIIAVAIIGSLSVASRLTRDAAVDVDYARVVRSVMDRVGVVWANTDGWRGEGDFQAGLDTAAEIQAFVDAQSNGECSAEILPPADGGVGGVAGVDDAVRVLQISCAPESGRLAQQVFQMEFGAP